MEEDDLLLSGHRKMSMYEIMKTLMDRKRKGNEASAEVRADALRSWSEGGFGRGRKPIDLANMTIGEQMEYTREMPSRKARQGNKIYVDPKESSVLTKWERALDRLKEKERLEGPSLPAEVMEARKRILEKHGGTVINRPETKSKDKMHEDESPDKEYIIETLLEKKLINKKSDRKRNNPSGIQYLVKWKSYRIPTWEPVEMLPEKMTQEFDKNEQPTKSKQSKASDAGDKSDSEDDEESQHREIEKIVRFQIKASFKKGVPGTRGYKVIYKGSKKEEWVDEEDVPVGLIEEFNKRARSSVFEAESRSQTKDSQIQSQSIGNRLSIAPEQNTIGRRSAADKRMDKMIQLMQRRLDAEQQALQESRKWEDADYTSDSSNSSDDEEGKRLREWQRHTRQLLRALREAKYEELKTKTAEHNERQQIELEREIKTIEESLAAIEEDISNERDKYTSHKPEAFYMPPPPIPFRHDDDHEMYVSTQKETKTQSPPSLQPRSPSSMDDTFLRYLHDGYDKHNIESLESPPHSQSSIPQIQSKTSLTHQKESTSSGGHSIDLRDSSTHERVVPASSSYVQQLESRKRKGYESQTHQISQETPLEFSHKTGKKTGNPIYVFNWKTIMEPGAARFENKNVYRLRRVWYQNMDLVYKDTLIPIEIREESKQLNNDTGKDEPIYIIDMLNYNKKFQRTILAFTSEIQKLGCKWLLDDYEHKHALDYEKKISLDKIPQDLFKDSYFNEDNDQPTPNPQTHQTRHDVAADQLKHLFRIRSLQGTAREIAAKTSTSNKEQSAINLELQLRGLDRIKALLASKSKPSTQDKI